MTTPLTPRLLAETQGTRLWFRPGQGPGTLVIFTPAAAPAGPSGWWQQRQAERLGWTTLVFAAHGRHWYAADEMAALLPAALAALPPGPRVTYGIGMGGYGALKYGRALDAAASVALAPVFSLDPAEMPGDPRTRLFDPARHAAMAVRGEDLAPLPVLAFDPLLPQERAQARRLAALPGVRAVPVWRGGSGIATILVEADRVAPLLQAALAGDAEGAAGVLREARRRSPRLRDAAAAAAAARGHAAWAAALAAEPRPDGEKPEAEEAALRRRIAAQPSVPGPRLALAQCLQRLRGPLAAAACLRDALLEGVQDDALLAALGRLLPRLDPGAEAAAVVGTALAAAPPGAAAETLRAECALWSGDPAAAEQAFRAALALAPGHGPALTGLALLEPDPAPDAPPGPHLAALLAGLADAPEGDWLRLIDRLWQGGRERAAILAAEAALRGQPAGAVRLGQRIARLLLAAGRSEEAIARYRHLTAARPEDLQSWIGLADALAALQRPAEAREALAQAASWHGEDAGLALRLAGLCLARNDASAAEREARRAVALDPAGEQGHLVLIEALRRLDRAEEAIAAARAALGALPGSGAVALRLGHLLAERADPDAATAYETALALMAPLPRGGGAQRAEALAGLVRLDPAPAADAPPGPRLAALLAWLDQADAADLEWLRAIDVLVHGGRLDSAAVLAAAAMRREAAPPLAQRIGRVLIAAGRLEEAAAFFRRRTAGHPQEAQSWIGLADALMQMRRQAEGREAMVRAVALHPGDAVLAARFATFLLATGEGAAAERAARRAVALDPDAENGHIVLIEALRHQHRRGDAIRAARAALERLPEAAHVAQRLGFMLAEAEDYPGAAEAYARVVEVLPRPPRSAWIGLVESLAAAGRVEEAEAAARRGIAADPDSEALRGLLGQLLLRQGEAASARDALASAMAEEAGSVTVDLAMAEGLLRQGRRREALALLQDRVAAAPGHVAAELRLGQLLLEDGQAEAAAALFTRLAEADAGCALAWVGLADAERLRKRVKPALAAYRQAVTAGADAQTLRGLRFRLFGEYDG